MNSYISIIISFLEEAGQIALENQNKLNINFKEDESIVTNTDIQISDLFRSKIKHLLDSGHILLDEENLINMEELYNDRNEYIWTIDPIDGTTTYSKLFPTWSIAVSLYKNFKPVLGFIYIPAINELVYTDGTDAFYVKNVSSNEQTISKIEPKTQIINKKSIIMAHRLQNYDINKFTFLDFYSAYILSFYTILGRASGTFLNQRCSLWDITSTLPFLKPCNLICKDVKTNRKVESIFDIKINNDWKLNSMYLMCNEDNYEEIKSVLTKIE